MDIKSNRKHQLRKWITRHSTPSAERSLFSQLINPDTPFGEKVARRLEIQYGMGVGYLDLSAEDARNKKGATDQLKSAPATDERIADEIIQLIIAYKNADQEGRRFILGAAQNVGKELQEFTKMVK